MLSITRRFQGTQPPAAQVVLPFELRQKSRLRVRLSTGQEAGLFLERGGVLRGGDLLLADDGTVVEVVAAAETVSTVRSLDAGDLLRAAYHLGNRHVPVQIGDGWLRYGHDHVLDDMVRGLGLEVVVEQAPFEPEAGAYGHGHTHGHEHKSIHLVGLGTHEHASHLARTPGSDTHRHEATGGHTHGAAGGHTHGATADYALENAVPGGKARP